MKTKFSLLFLFFILNLSLFAQDVRVLSSDNSSITIEYLPVYSDTTYFIQNGESCFNIRINNTYIKNLNSRTKIQFPLRELKIGVQSEIGNTIQILSADYSAIEGKYYFKNPDELNQTNEFINSAGNDIDLNETVVFGDFSLLRNLSVQSILIYPVKYDYGTKSTKLLKKVIFKISIASTPSRKEKINNMNLTGVILNWKEAQNWGQVQVRLNKTTSYLSAGDWYRFVTPSEGIYKIDKNFLSGLGIDVNSLDPRTIKIYGNGGYALPEDPNAARPPGFKEIAIQFVGKSEDTFGDSDYILFYGRGPNFWEYSKTYDKIARVKDPYSRVNYYWLTYGGENGKRVADKQSLNESGAYKPSYTYAFRSIDKDSTNIGKTGRDYFGDVITKSSNVKLYLTTLNSIIPSSQIDYHYRVANTSSPIVTFHMYENNQLILTKNISGTYQYVFGIDSEGTASYTGPLSGETSNLKLTLTTTGSDASIAIDYIEFTYRSQLKAFNDNFILFSKDTTATLDYTVTNFSNSSIQAYDITDYANVQLISGANINGSQIEFQCSENENNVKKYYIVNPNAYLTPSDGQKIENTDLRSNIAGSELVVITDKTFKEQADRYAAYRSNESPNKMSTSVYYVKDIYNEFSNGMADPTAIRDFLKYAYDNWQVKPYYVLLFGDGTYDILNSENLNNNFVPTYQTKESLYEINSYPTDDYYGRVSGNDKSVDLAIGRLCIDNTDEAKIAVDKIIKYETGSDKGLWRNTITLVADDGPAGLGADDHEIHTAQSESLTVKIPSSFDLDKIYLAAYPTVITGLGRRKPEVNKAIINAINNGTLIFNYIGHGNPSLLAHENVFEKSVTIPQLNNGNYFFLTAATCDFGKYDDPDEQSSVELLLNKADAGAIAAFTAARVVYSTQNAAINDSLYSNLFGSKDINNLPRRIGQAYMFAKETRTNANDEKFHLLGDPTIRLDEPEIPVKIDSVNNKSLDATVQISALGSVKINGTVRNQNGSKSDFDGQTVVSVYDSKRQLYLPEMDYTVTLQGGLIYRGRATITNGEFQTAFVVPKDISYENKNGKISAYIFNDSEDGIGYSDNIRVGGADSSVTNDGKGPDIEIYFNNENNQNSYLVNQDFTLIAKLSDQIGLNTTGTGIGHKLEGILNDDLTNTIDFTNSFVGDLNSGGKSGTIKYNFTSMDPGDYKIVVKAWDVFNNFSSQTAYFTVISDEQGIVVRDVVNYPNPFSNNTTFTFNHNITGAINAKVKVYTIAGRMIKEIDENDLLDKFVKIDWDGRDDDGNMIANGTYLYKLTVESSDGKYKDSVLGKLAVLR